MQVARLVEDAKLALQGKPPQGLFFILLDIEKAFDKVWHERLISKLDSFCKLPIALCSLLQAFNNVLSSPRIAEALVPQ
ncbi:hypothetical protein D910_09050 [Dendroctonus ponderosae]|uniref:Reverse transcriptase domain-containing protein n=1 Tax=Dendroctonus ponderosae TaxID=77166 RepID=U4UH77_DENPD|nr:hypothetical protein D910_09050 [Dendroctonus ponderosae]